MPTIKQKRLAKELVDSLNQDVPPTAGQILEKIGYSKGIQKSPSQVIKTVGVQEALADLGFTEEAAKGVVASIMHGSDNDMARLKASDQVFKVLGSYAAEKHETKNLNIDVSMTPQSTALALKYEEEYQQMLLK